MPRNPIGRNDPCPCGSGRKYKQCCKDKDIAWETDESGKYIRRVPMSEDLAEAMTAHMEQLKGHYGRELEDDDLLFPDLQLEHIEHQMSQAMQQVGIDPALIYAFEQTGLVVSEQNQDSISDVDLAAWYAAIEVYRNRTGLPTQDYPLGTVALYGPDETITTKLVASVFIDAQSEPIQKKFFGDHVDDDPQVARQVVEFFRQHGVEKSVATGGNIGCPHEEGIDYPLGDVCPQCPYWHDQPEF